MDKYLDIFIEDEIPSFMLKYLETKTLKRIMNVTQFCGCDYIGVYSPRFTYYRYNHSIVAALIVYHFTHDKRETIKALLHDVGTPCFAHTIDYLFGDYIKQVSAEKKLSQIIMEDEELLKYLSIDGIDVLELDDLSDCCILENHHPNLCADRLDGVLHTNYIWLNITPLSVIKEVYDDITVLENETGKPELGFKSVDRCLEFVDLAKRYALELQSNRVKYTQHYISEVIKECVNRNLLTLNDLYSKKESEIVDMFAREFKSWSQFISAKEVISTSDMPDDFYVSVDVKRRNVIPLVQLGSNCARITQVSEYAKLTYDYISKYEDMKYAYIKGLKKVE